MIEKRLDNSRQWLPPTGPKTTREEFEWTILNDRIFANEASSEPWSNRLPAAGRRSQPTERDSSTCRRRMNDHRTQ